MASKSLAVKYRPATFDDVTEQDALKMILTQQLATGTYKNAYLFCGPAGCGKTTCARIFANEINHGEGNPIEQDAASNNSVDDARELIAQAKTKSLDSEYKVFILDECHMLSNGAWNALLKLIEEPPAKSIFIFCTTDPQKIPRTILSRVQRYDIQKISQEGICRRLELIYQIEAVDNNWKCDYNYKDAMEYIAKLAEGGMRDAISYLDKCLAYSTDLTVENVVKALGVANYEQMFDMMNGFFLHDATIAIKVIDDVYSSGKDLKQFIKTFTSFVLDICKFGILKDMSYLQIPNTYSDKLHKYSNQEFVVANKLLKTLINLNSDIKWETSPKVMIEAVFMLECTE